MPVLENAVKRFVTCEGTNDPKHQREISHIADSRASSHSPGIIGRTGDRALIDEKPGCDNLRETQFRFKHGTVIWISISDSEWNEKYIPTPAPM